MSLSIYNHLPKIDKRTIDGIAWKVTVDFNDQRHLFHEKIETDYVVDGYVCSCGREECIIRNSYQDSFYICDECGNDFFYNANSARQNFHSFISDNQIELHYEYKINTTSQGISVSYVTTVPSSVDLLRGEIIVEPVNVYEIFVGHDGSYRKDYLMDEDEKVFKEMEKKLIHYITTYQYFDIPFHTDGKKFSIAKILFYLKNRHLKSSAFYYWTDVDVFITDKSKNYDVTRALNHITCGREERSVKRAIYRYYLISMAYDSHFHPGIITVLCQQIKDPNILVRFLNLDILHKINISSKQGLETLEYSERIMSLLNLYANFWNEIELLIIFLKQYYTEKQIVKLFLNSSINEQEFSFFRDTLYMVMDDIENIGEYFQKVRCSVMALHDEFVRCVRMIEQKEIEGVNFSYSKSDVEKCMRVEDYKVHVPKSNKELFLWGDTLHNCLSGYASAVKRRSLTIYGFFYRKELQFAVNITNGKISEARGKYNANLDFEENGALYAWYESNF